MRRFFHLQAGLSASAERAAGGYFPVGAGPPNGAAGNGLASVRVL